MSDRRIVTVQYCERELQKTISVPSSSTIAEAKAAASKGLLDQLRRLPGIPPTLALDDERVDIYQACKIPSTKIGDPDASGESTQCSTPSQSVPQSPPQTVQSNPRPTSDRRDVTMMYCEEGLRITLLAPSSLTVAEVKAAALVGMCEHLRDVLGIPMTLDNTRVDIHPACSTSDLTIGDLCASGKAIMIVVWPKATPGSTIMASPIMDALGSAAAKLADIMARLSPAELPVEKLDSKKSKSKRTGSSSTLPPTSVAQDSAPADSGGIVGGLLATEARISEAREAERAQLWAEKAKLETENAKLQAERAKLEAERAKLWAKEAGLCAEKMELLRRVKV
ncbi:hypothetical protein BD779DRAFT_1476897 [Infundibulicybe gibba]|nr:hypothetical protein BD779DRAFT_1476897 [Infundibulicybe gibba]